MKENKMNRVLLSVKVSSSIALAALLIFLTNNASNGGVVEDQATPTINTPDTTSQQEKVQIKQEPQQQDIGVLVNAMIQVESRDNDSAYCASEDAVGCLQIRPIMVSEVNRILKKQAYTLQDRWDRAKSVEMLKVFAKYYKLTTFEDIARCWNGGPRGNEYASTDRYWNKVQNEMI